MPVGNWILRLLLEARRRQVVAARVEPEPVPPPRLAAAAYAVWWCGIGALVLVVLNVDLLLPHGPRAGVRIALGAMLLPLGLVLAFDRGSVRRLVLARFPKRGRRMLIGAALQLLGVVWVGAGAFDLLRGLRDVL